MRENTDKIIDDLLQVYQDLLIPFMKVQRDIPFPTQSTRVENDAEHTFTLAMLSLTLAEKIAPKLDRGKIAQYALVHDLVEAYAGDTSAKLPEHHQVKKVSKEREAMLEIEQRFLKIAPWIPATIQRYEQKGDKESLFVYAVDKNTGALNWLAGDGIGWLDYYPETEAGLYEKTVERLRKKAAKFPELLGLFDGVHELLTSRIASYKTKIQKRTKKDK